MDLRNSRIKLVSNDEINATLAAYTEHTVQSVICGDVVDQKIWDFLDLLNTAACHNRKTFDITNVVEGMHLLIRLNDFVNNTDKSVEEIAEDMSAPLEIEPLLTRRHLGSIAAGMVFDLREEQDIRNFANSLKNLDSSQI